MLSLSLNLSLPRCFIAIRVIQYHASTLLVSQASFSFLPLQIEVCSHSHWKGEYTDETSQVSSTSNCTDYQSRRLLIRYKPPYTPPPPGPELAQQGSPSTTSNEPLPFAHTLNGTAAAIPRLILALLENGVRLGKDGEIEGLDLPEALKRFWVGGGEMRGKDGKVGEIRWV